MNTASTKPISPELNLGRLKGRQIIANFEGGRITSDAGIVLMAELEKKLRITARFAEGFQDYRNPSYVDYPVHQLLAQRVYGIILGYEDVNDHDKLRSDPALAIALEKLDSLDSNKAELAGKSTINRLEYCPETILDQATSRYHKIEALAPEIERTFVNIFLSSYSTPPKRIIAFFNLVRYNQGDRVELLRSSYALLFAAALAIARSRRLRLESRDNAGASLPRYMSRSETPLMRSQRKNYETLFS